MAKERKAILRVEGAPISVLSGERGDYLSLTDMAKKFGDDNLIYSWMRNRNTVEFLGIWEAMNNPDFKGLEFATFKTEAGLNSFHLTPRKWIEATCAVGIRSQAGRYNGGTFAHQDIAFEFGTWLSPEFKLYLIKEFQRLKAEEAEKASLDWNLKRTLSKLNYRIHTDAIKDNIIPQLVPGEQEKFVYASEADLINTAIFGMTARQWQDANPGVEGNMRDHASMIELLVLTNLEATNAQMIREGMSPNERLRRLTMEANQQLKSLGSIRRVLDSSPDALE